MGQLDNSAKGKHIVQNDFMKNIQAFHEIEEFKTEIVTSWKDIFTVTIPTAVISAIFTYYLLFFIIKKYGLNSDASTTIFCLIVAAALTIQLIGSKIIDMNYKKKTKGFEKELDKLKADLDRDINEMIIKECSKN